MKLIFTAISYFVFLLNVTAQNFPAGNQTITFTDASRNGRQIPAVIYYPANSTGNNVPLASGIDSFPVVVFGHGFVIPLSAYEWLADSLASRGYIVAFPSTGGELFPSHTDFGNDLFFLCNYITSLNDSAESFLYHRVIKSAAVAGHSMGGGCSFLAAANNSDAVKAIFNFAAAETNPSAIAAASAVSKPALIFSGSSDCIAAPSSQQQMYANIAASCKAYINITGAIHCQFANNNGTCVLGQTLSGCNSSSVTPPVVFNKVITVLIPFLDYYLKNNCNSGTDFLAAYNNLGGADKTISCNTIVGCGVLPVTLQNFKGVLKGNQVNLSWKVSAQDHLSYFVAEKSGDGITFQPMEKVNSLPSLNTASSYKSNDAYPFPGKSFYRLKLYNKDGSFTISSVINLNTPAKQFAIIRLLPNPAKENMQIQLSSGSEQKIFLSIHNIHGQVPVKQIFSLSSGINTKNISIQGLMPGFYVILFTSDSGRFLGSIKIEKE